MRGSTLSCNFRSVMKRIIIGTTIFSPDLGVITTSNGIGSPAELTRNSAVAPPPGIVPSKTRFRSQCERTGLA